VKLRIGVVLWLLSWVPYGIILGLSGAWYTLAWTFEIVLGLIGLALAGSEFGQAVKDRGWKHAPGVAWHALIHGKDVDEVKVDELGNPLEEEDG
jgi:hypothetical protein